MAKEEPRTTEVMEELSGLLTAISIVSKRLAENLKKLNERKEAAVNAKRT